MTYKEFLAALRKTPRRWLLNDTDEIRCRTGRCPIEKVLGLKAGTVGFGDDQSELSSYTAGNIMTAADWYEENWLNPRQKKIRRDLLKACGLKERT